MASGPAKPEEIIKVTKTGLLVKEVTGYGINPVNGNFSGREEPNETFSPG